MDNKDFIKLLTGFPMKSEIEILLPDGTFVKTIEVKRIFIPENREKGTKGRNIVQVIPLTLGKKPT